MTGEREERPTSGSAGHEVPSAAGLRDLMEAFASARIYREDNQARVAAERRLAEVRAKIDRHVTDAALRACLHRAEEAARHGQHEALILKFPSSQCADGGRAINLRDARWPDTLSGAAAEAYQAFRRDLEPQGFHVECRILEYPNGNLGDAGMFLSWMPASSQAPPSNART